MSILYKLPEILSDSRKAYEALIADTTHSDTVTQEPNGIYRITERIQQRKDGQDNVVALGDNLSFMKQLLTGKGLEGSSMAGKLQLIYIDPPFFSKSDYGAEFKLASDQMDKIPVIRHKAYQDTWENGLSDYLYMLALRLFLMRDLLSESGSIFLHLDWHVVHYVKLIMDEIFGEKQFINEIVWTYKSGGVSKNHFARKHDTILFYAKTPYYFFSAQQEKSYNRGYKPYRFKGVKEYKDDLGWYTMVNRKDVWSIDMVGRTSAERTGYVTQKPEQLLARILESCTKEGDLCADFFGGSGTMAATANKMGRKFLLCDIGKLAMINSVKRLIADGASFSVYEEGMATCESQKTQELEKFQFGKFTSLIYKINYNDTASVKLKITEGTLFFDLVLQPEPMTGQHELSINLVAYHSENLKDFPILEQYFPVIEDILNKDSLQLLDYWSVDFNYDGKIFQPQIFFSKEKDQIEKSGSKIQRGFQTIAVRAVNLFGDSSFTVIKFETKAKKEE